jgi:hypothetical protein
VSAMPGCMVHRQNRKYRCDMGKVWAGSQTSSSPSARTA